MKREINTDVILSIGHGAFCEKRHFRGASGRIQDDLAMICDVCNIDTRSVYAAIRQLFRLLDRGYDLDEARMQAAFDALLYAAMYHRPRLGLDRGVYGCGWVYGMDGYIRHDPAAWY